MQFCVVKSEPCRVANWLLFNVEKDYFLIVKVREGIVTVGRERLREHFVWPSSIRSHYIIPLNFIVILITISSIASLSLVYDVTGPNILWLLHQVVDREIGAFFHLLKEGVSFVVLLILFVSDFHTYILYFHGLFIWILLIWNYLLILFSKLFIFTNIILIKGFWRAPCNSFKHPKLQFIILVKLVDYFDNFNAHA